MPRIVHLGFGNFHRAHQAWYTARANAKTGSAWRITGVSMRNRALRDALAPDGFAYTLAERGPRGLVCQRVNVHDRVLVAAEEPDAVIAAIADPDTHVITLTITEKGYDLTTAGPDSAVGLLARGLVQRARHGARLTVVSCDNLPENGAVLQRAVRDWLEQRGTGIGSYLTEQVRFPATMVDRITPATSEAIRAEIAGATGGAEPAPVLTEAFSEWVIADDFAGPHPDWAAVGAVIAADVGPFESRKLLMLNAAHSWLAYAGLCRRHVHVHEAIADPNLRRGTEALWDLAAHALPKAIHAGLPAYRAALLSRFEVVEMRHRLDQIAMDGSLKLPVRIVPLLRAANEAGAGPDAAVAAISAWIAYLVTSAAQGDTAADPGITELLGLARDRNLERLVPDALHRIGLGPEIPTLEVAIRRKANAFL